jgi:hypothetical protein
MSPGVGGERGFVAEFREKGAHLGNYLCALADGGGNALYRTLAGCGKSRFIGPRSGIKFAVRGEMWGTSDARLG